MSIITKYVDNNKFNTTLINFVFQFKCDKSEIMAHAILCRLLSFTNGIFKEEDAFARAKLNNYVMNYNVMCQSINDVSFVNFSLLIPNEGVVDDFKIEDSIKFLLDSIYIPNIENGLYDKKLFEREKRLYTENILNNYKNVGFIAEKNMLDLLDKDGIFNKIKYKDLENIGNLSNSDVVDFYNKYIKNVKPLVFVNGKTNIKRIEKVIDRYISKMDLMDQVLITDYNNFYNNDILIDETEHSDFFQSIVYMVYTIKDYNVSDFYKLYLINLILSSSSSDLLLYNLRKKNNLVYACGSSALLKNGLLMVKAITSKKNIKLAKMVIEDVMNSLKDIDKYKDNIGNIMYRLSLNLEREKDDFYVCTSNIINEYFKSDITSEEEFDIISNIEKDDLLDVINRIELKCMYTLEGNRE